MSSDLVFKLELNVLEYSDPMDIIFDNRNKRFPDGISDVSVQQKTKTRTMRFKDNLRMKHRTSFSEATSVELLFSK